MTYQEYMEMHHTFSEKEQLKKHHELYSQLVSPKLLSFLDKYLGDSLASYEDKRYWNDKGLKYWDNVVVLAKSFISDTKRKQLGFANSSSTYICIVKAAVRTIWAKRKPQESEE